MSSGLRASVACEVGSLRLDAHLDALPGEVSVVVGPNGAGKSTLLRALCGLQPIRSGRIELDGEVLDDPAQGVFVEPPKRRVAFATQDRGLFTSMRVIDNVAFGLKVRGHSRSHARRSAHEWLERFDADHLAARSVRDLSGGEAQRVALARAAASEPRMLLLDEPSSALDSTARRAIRSLIAVELRALRIPIVLVTHDPMEAITMGDTIAVLEDGRVTQRATPDAIRARPASPYVAEFVGVNSWRGTRAGSVVVVADGSHEIAVVDDADSTAAGAAVAPAAVTVVVHPRAVTLYRQAVSASARNQWETLVAAIERDGDRVRVRCDLPVPIVAEITAGALTALNIEVGARVWVAFKATDVAVHADSW